MSEDRTAIEAAGYVLGALTLTEHARFEQALATSPALKREVSELSAAAAALRSAAAPLSLPPGLRERTLAAVAQEAGGFAPSRTDGEPVARARPARPRSWWSRPLRPVPRFAFVMSVAAALSAGAYLLAPSISGPRPEFELLAQLEGLGGKQATARVVKTGIGREISFSSPNLPILPTGQYYEIWFVGPGDTPSTPNRVSAGTFHPDADGNSEVEFSGAVDPAKLPVIEVTREVGPRDLKPGPTVVSTEGKRGPQ